MIKQKVFGMREKLNILLLSGTPPYQHSGILALDIINSLKEGGHKVELITKFHDKGYEANVKSVYGALTTLIIKAKNRIFNLINRKETPRDFNYYIFDLGYSKKKISTRRILSKISNKPDLIIYLFPHFFLNEENLYELNKKTGAPIIQFPVDMDPFTGGCHYFWDCTGYQTGCGSCPGLYSDDKSDITFQNMLYKKKFLDKTDIFPIGGLYMLGIISKSYLYEFKKSFNIDLVINEKTFFPNNQINGRKYFNLPLDKKIIFFGALSLTEKRKGITYLLESLFLLKNSQTEAEQNNTIIVMAGALKDKIDEMIPFPVYQLGWISQKELPFAFQAADLFVCPSIEDAGPMMTIQSLMTGVPVIAFKTGNSGEMIENGVTGYKVDKYDVQGMMDGILGILRLSKEDKQVMTENCRKSTLEKSSYTAFTKKIEDAYTIIKDTLAVNEKFST